MNFWDQFMGRYGPGMAGSEQMGHPFAGMQPHLQGFSAHTGGPGQMQQGGFNAHTGGVMPPMPTMYANTGGGLPAMAQGFPSAQTGGGLPPMQGGFSAGTGGYDAPHAAFNANTGGGFQPQQGLPPYARQMAQAHMPGFMPPGLAGFFNSGSDRGTHNGRALAYGDNQRFTDSRGLRGVSDYADRAYR